MFLLVAEAEVGLVRGHLRELGVALDCLSPQELAGRKQTHHIPYMFAAEVAAGVERHLLLTTAA